MSNRVEGKVVVVTGGGQGQGAAEARLLAAEGATVVASTSGTHLPRISRGPSTAARRHRRRRLGRACRRPANPARTGARPGRQCGHHLAGPADRPRPGRSGARLGGQRHRDLLGIQALTPLMPAGGSIVVVGSTAALTGHYPVAYTTSKWALRGLAKAACLELGPRGIRVNTIHPGYIQTPMTASASRAFLDASIAETPGPARHGRRGRPAGGVPAQRRCLVHHRRRDSGRRRDDRSRRREVHQRRGPGGDVTDRPRARSR